MSRLNLQLVAESKIPVYQQIYEQVREKILQGEMPAHTSLPPSRQLAHQYHIGRITVTTAYEQLEAEGFVYGRVGAGTYVADLPLDIALPLSSSVPDLSDWGNRLTVEEPTLWSSTSRSASSAFIDFGFGRVFASLFPYGIWRRLLDNYLSTDDAILSRYGSPAGFEPLRQALASYLTRGRGVRCRSEQVIIVNGVQQALDILARLYLTEGDAVLVESPGYADAFEIFRLQGAQLWGVAVDGAGMPAETLSNYPSAKFIFVTPAHQFPRGGTMPLRRRLQLLAWAEAQGSLIIEDDYDSELRYQGHTPAALQSLDRTGRVIYLGTFSKVLFPALRLGYVILPESLCPPFIQAMQLLGRGSPTLTQAAVADFIIEGHFERHVHRLRQAYGQRRQVLVSALQDCLGDIVYYSPDEAGLHVMVYLPSEIEEGELVRQAAAAGVGVYAGTKYHLQIPPPPSLLLGFSGLSEAEIVEGVRRLSVVIRNLLLHRN